MKEHMSYISVLGVLCQDDETLAQEKELCKDKSAGELFRLKVGKMLAEMSSSVQPL